MAQLPVYTNLQIRYPIALVAAVLVTCSLTSGCRSSNARTTTSRTVAASHPVMLSETHTEQTGGETAVPESDLRQPGTDASMEISAAEAMANPYEPLIESDLANEAVPLIGEFTPLPDESVSAPAVAADPVATATTEPVVSAEQTLKQIRHLGGNFELSETGDVHSVDLSFTAITADQLEGLGHFRNLSELDLTGTTTHDESLPVIAGLNNLRSLKLKGTRISDKGLQQLSTLSELRLLDLSRTDITDAGLSEAAAWKQLTYLSLNNTAISDSGLQSLSTLKNLKGLNLVRSKVTPEGVTILQSALPGCLVISGSPDAPQVEPGGEEKAGQTRVRTISIAGEAEPGAGDSQLSQVIALAALQPELAVHLSAVYSSTGRWQEAALILHAAAQVNDLDPMIQFRLGESLAHSGFRAEALQCFRRSVGDAAANYNLGLIVYEKMLQECEQYFENSVQADPRLDVAVLRLKEVRRELAMSRKLPLPARRERTSSLASHNGTPGYIQGELPTGSMVTESGSVPEVIPGTHVYRSISSAQQTNNSILRPYVGSSLPEWLQTTDHSTDL